MFDLSVCGEQGVGAVGMCKWILGCLDANFEIGVVQVMAQFCAGLTLTDLSIRQLKALAAIMQAILKWVAC